MKLVFPVLFIVSLLGNVALGVYTLRERHAPDSTASAAAQPNATTNSATKAAAVTTAAPDKTSMPAWRTPRTDDDLRSVVGSMRAAGYPPSVMRAVVNQLLKERFAESTAETNQPFWKRAQPTPEILAAQQARNNEMNDAREAILGADGRPSSSLEPADRARRYGNLSDEKIDALIKLEREHNDIRSMTYAARSNNASTGMANAMDQQQLLEKEKLADLASVLTPDELEQYEMRNSRAASRVQSNIRNVDVSEEEYAQLYRIQKANEDTNRIPVNSAAGYANQLLTQAEINNQAKTVLGEDRFYKYLEGADSRYATVSNFTKQYPDVSPQTSYQLYQLQNELQAAMMNRSSTRPTTPEAQQQAMKEMRAIQETYNQRLQSLLPPNIADAYRKQGMGRMFAPNPQSR